MGALADAELSSGVGSSEVSAKICESSGVLQRKWFEYCAPKAELADRRTSEKLNEWTRLALDLILAVCHHVRCSNYVLFSLRLLNPELADPTQELQLLNTRCVWCRL